MRTTVKQYPSIITWKEGWTNTTQDSDGNIIPGVPGNTVTAKCRFENYLASGNRKQLIGRDGLTVLATGKILIKFGEATPPRFSLATITTNGNEIYNGEIINPYQGQMNKTVYAIEDVRD